MKANPWFISDEAAAARDKAVASEILDVVAACTLLGASNKEIIHTLQAGGITESTYHRLMPLIDEEIKRRGW
jgi:hypothetical protein